MALDPHVSPLAVSALCHKRRRDELEPEPHLDATLWTLVGGGDEPRLEPRRKVLTWVSQMAVDFCDALLQPELRLPGHRLVDAPLLQHVMDLIYTDGTAEQHGYRQEVFCASVQQKPLPPSGWPAPLPDLTDLPFRSFDDQARQRDAVPSLQRWREQLEAHKSLLLLDPVLYGPRHLSAVLLQHYDDRLLPKKPWTPTAEAL